MDRIFISLSIYDKKSSLEKSYLTVQCEKAHDTWNFYYFYMFLAPLRWRVPWFLIASLFHSFIRSHAPKKTALWVVYGLRFTKNTGNYIELIKSKLLVNPTLFTNFIYWIQFYDSRSTQWYQILLIMQSLSF